MSKDQPGLKKQPDDDVSVSSSSADSFVDMPLFNHARSHHRSQVMARIGRGKRDFIRSSSVESHGYLFRKGSASAVDGMLDGFHPVSPSPKKKKKFTSATIVSDELADSDEDMNKKPSARNFSKEDSEESDTECGDDDVEEDRRTKKRAKSKKQFRARNFSKEENEETDTEYGGDDVEDDRRTKKREKSKKQFRAAKKALINFGSYTLEEIDSKLREIGPPYTKLQAVALAIQRDRKRNSSEARLGVFQVDLGMIVRKPFDGTEYEGMVVYKHKGETELNDGVSLGDTWRVVYEDGDEEDLQYDELLRFRHPKPEFSRCRGRAMQCLELFCGKAIISQEFRQRQWKTISIDIDEDSNATLCADILDIEPEDLDFVADFIWASPPCHTYSRLAGGKHRCAKKGEFEKSEEACKNNEFFTKMVQIMRAAKAKHPHLIVAIENPVGQLQKMPMMEHLTEFFGVQQVRVDYCAFGRNEQKPTIIWTNDFGLRDSLAQFRCEERCHVGGRGNHEGIQGQCHRYDFGVIPQPLAEEVAAYVDAKFIINRIRRTKAENPWQEVAGKNDLCFL